MVALLLPPYYDSALLVRCVGRRLCVPTNQTPATLVRAGDCCHLQLVRHSMDGCAIVSSGDQPAQSTTNLQFTCHRADEAFPTLHTVDICRQADLLVSQRDSDGSLVGCRANQEDVV